MGLAGPVLDVRAAPFAILALGLLFFGKRRSRRWWAASLLGAAWLVEQGATRQVSGFGMDNLSPALLAVELAVVPGLVALAWGVSQRTVRRGSGDCWCCRPSCPCRWAWRWGRRHSSPR
ncbi:MAG: hypothetical protein R2734_13165 [Nocardioides sp.]